MLLSPKETVVNVTAKSKTKKKSCKMEREKESNAIIRVLEWTALRTRVEKKKTKIKWTG